VLICVAPLPAVVLTVPDVLDLHLISIRNVGHVAAVELAFEQIHTKNSEQSNVKDRNHNQIKNSWYDALERSNGDFETWVSLNHSKRSQYPEKSHRFVELKICAAQWQVSQQRYENDKEIKLVPRLAEVASGAIKQKTESNDLN